MSKRVGYRNICIKFYTKEKGMEMYPNLERRGRNGNTKLYLKRKGWQYIQIYRKRKAWQYARLYRKEEGMAIYPNF